MKKLIAYYSYTSNNAQLASHLQKLIHCDLMKIETEKKRNGFSIVLDLVFKRKVRIKPLAVRLSDYDHVIFVGPIWAGKIASPIRSLLIDEKENIRSYSFLTLCGGGNPGQLQHIREELVSLMQMAPRTVFELWINDLLPSEKKNTVKYTSGFRIQESGFAPFATKLQEFIDKERLIQAREVLA